MTPDPKGQAIEGVKSAEQVLSDALDVDNGGSDYGPELAELQSSLENLADVMGWDKAWGGSVE